MILIVCPNLAVDVTLEIDRLEVGEVHRARASRRQAGGKGVNLARALRSLGALGEDPLVLGFVGGRAGDAITDGLAAEGIASDLVPFAGESRTCTILLTGNGAATVVNEAGPEIHEASNLTRRFEASIDRCRAAAFMGSLPPGVPPGTYASLIHLVREANRSCLLDTSGEALRLGLGARPSVVKPNRAEAEELVGFELANQSLQTRAVQEIRKLGADVALVTLGSEGFLMAAGGGTARYAASPSSDLRLGNPTGAGDALAAGFLAGMVRGYSPHECARLAAASASASLAEGYGRFRAKDVRVEAVRFERIQGDVTKPGN